MRRLRLLVLPLAALAITAGVTGCSRPGAKASVPKDAAVVTIKHLMFNPPKITVDAGQTVYWHFDDDGVGHNVTSVPETGPLHSGEREHGYYSFRFTKTGTYHYECTIHIQDGMIGEVIVR